MAFKGKVALITGGGSGMGQISAWKLAALGADVHVAALDVNKDGLAKTAEGHANIHPYVVDVRDNDRLLEVIGEVEKKYGTIERVVCAAGIMPANLLLEDTRENIIRVMEVNYFGTVNVLMAILPKMVARRGGDFIAFGSTAGIVPTAYFGAYGPSKAAVNFLLETAYWENRKSGVRIFLAAPPAVETPLLDQAPKNKAVQDSRKKGQVMKPEDMVDAIEKAIEKGKFVSYGDLLGNVVVLARRFVPRLFWKMIIRMNAL